MPELKLNGKTYSGSTNYASAIKYVEEDGSKTTVQDKISELDSNFANSNISYTPIQIKHTTSSISDVIYNFNVTQAGVIILNGSMLSDTTKDTGTNRVTVKVNGVIVADTCNRMGNSEATSNGESLSFSGVVNIGDIVTVILSSGKTGTKDMYITGVCMFGCNVEW